MDATEHLWTVGNGLKRRQGAGFGFVTRFGGKRDRGISWAPVFLTVLIPQRLMA